MIALGWGPAVASAQAPAYCEEWWGSGAEPYPYPLGGIAHNLPECRVGVGGTEDLGTSAWRLRDGRRLSMRRSLGTLEPNPAEGGRVRWPLLDSSGRPLAVLERRSNHWATTHPDTGRVVHRDFVLGPRALVVQGRGCMVDDALESRHALIAFPSHARTTLPGGASLVPFQIRAFVDRAALPARDARDRPVRDAVDSYRTGCDEAEGRAGPPRVAEDPAFELRRQGFLGEDGLRRPYATYNVKGAYGGARYLMVNTTGVHGGGIVRGVVRAGDRLARLDGLGYCDPNAAGGRPLARWSYVRAPGTRLGGWIADRCGER